jgi:uncharacterized membrane-anchored protein
MAERVSWAAIARRGALRVPQITAAFWITKGLSTALGESTSDYSVHAIAPQLAVIGGFVAFVVALAIQLRQGRYQRWAYWFAVAMVGVFGTMAADVLHVGLGVPYVVSSVLYAVALAAVFATWRATEHTLSIHTIDSARRELFYWATVVATFAMGTAVGDYTAITVNLGYFPSAALFGGLILVPAVGYRWLHWNPVACFWTAYVLTRPLGASIADGLGKPRADHGLGWGAGPVAVGFAVAMVALVGYLALTRHDEQAELAVHTATFQADAERA